MRARLAPVLLALTVLAAACSDDADGGASPTLPPVTEAPSASASPTAAAVPSEATAATPEGAAEFARLFVNEVHAGYEELDPERVRRLSAPDCGTCQRYIDTIESIREQRATIGNSYTVDVVDAAAPQEQPGATATSVTVILSIGEFVVTGADGSELLREPANNQSVQAISLERFGDGWRVTEVAND